MIRLKLAIPFLFAAIVAVEPVLHNHPLAPASAGGDTSALTSSQTVCAACAIGSDRILVVPPTFATPLLIAFGLVFLPRFEAGGGNPLILCSRAPPAP